LSQRYSEAWLLEQCWGLADALAIVHGFGDSADGSSIISQLHADIKPENILCFAVADEDGGGPFTLKLADFGEAQRASNNRVNTTSVPHTKTYRPPEHDIVNFLTLQYDIWCLGCVFLELITWAINGTKSLKDFENARFEERDDKRATVAKGNVRFDTFFKKKAKNRWQGLFSGFKLKYESYVHFGPQGPRDIAKKQHQLSFEHTSGRVNPQLKSVVKSVSSYLQPTPHPPAC
jgi:serine/threonine protein kinase